MQLRTYISKLEDRLTGNLPSTTTLVQPVDPRQNFVAGTLARTSGTLTEGRLALVGPSGVITDDADLSCSLGIMAAGAGTETGLVLAKSLDVSGGASTSSVQGLRAVTTVQGSSTYSSNTIYSINGVTTYAGSGTLAGATALRGSLTNSGSGTLGSGSSMKAEGGINSGGGHITNWSDVRCETPLAPTGNNQARHGLFVAAMPTPGAFTGVAIASVFLADTSRTPRSGIHFDNGSIALYPSAASTLKTDGSLHVGTAFQTGSSAVVGTALQVGTTLTVLGQFSHQGSTLGFYNATPISKGVITGSKGGNSALSSLINALVALGLLTDGTT